MRVDFCSDLLIFDSRSDHDSKGNGGLATSVTLLLLGVTPLLAYYVKSKIALIKLTVGFLVLQT